MCISGLCIRGHLLAAIVMFFGRVGLSNMEVGINVSTREVRCGGNKGVLRLWTAGRCVATNVPTSKLIRTQGYDMLGIKPTSSGRNPSVSCRHQRSAIP